MGFPYKIQPHMIGESEDVIEYTNFSSDIDFVATFGQAVRTLEIVTASNGTIVIQTVGSGSLATPVNRTLTALASGYYIGAQTTKIVASGTSGITKVRAWL